MKIICQNIEPVDMFRQSLDIDTVQKGVIVGKNAGETIILPESLTKLFHERSLNVLDSLNVRKCLL